MQLLCESCVSTINTQIAVYMLMLYIFSSSHKLSSILLSLEDVSHLCIKLKTHFIISLTMTNCVI